MQDYELYLEHHGIKGQKWGIRRFQNKDGSLTAAGEKRYNVDTASAKNRVSEAKKAYKNELKRYNKKTIGGYLYNKEAAQRLNKAEQKVQWEKEKLNNEKIKNKLNKENGVSKHRQKLIDKYIKDGMSQERAEIAAYKRDRTEKAIGTMAGLTIAAASLYVAKKSYDKRVDKLIPAGTLLQNISIDGDKGVKDAFYASMTKMDNHKYRGMYGRQIKEVLGQNTKVFETKINVKSSMKVASEKSGTKILAELIGKDTEYANTLKKHLSDSIDYPLDEQRDIISKGFISLKEGKVNTNVYNALNMTLSDHNLPTSDKVSKDFYNALKSKGYDAISDINDKKYSGYKSSNPLIIFNGSAKTIVQNRREILDDEMTKSYIKGVSDITIKTLAPQTAVGAVSLGLVSVGNHTMQNRQRNQIVSEYKKKHPGTKLSYNEILDNYYN